ncbi:hypothetical protein [Alkalihalobacterium chitinilyticum]|uniref:DUF1641 domain-containing protein n=1 Tax=Alkalihalobacterium chitinilyticum TaxID=2980103 RepID=A0ABT5VDA5_9BACI|nr:hypothetical protein [Alkalihalobacterium chitinilyticum]MDE5413418.1 hypothetical protein [Alkalihalobacterium chitinilyticum]
MTKVLEKDQREVLQNLDPEVLSSLLSKAEVLDDALTMVKIASDALTSETIENLTKKIEKAAVLLELIERPELFKMLDELITVGEKLLPMLDRLGDLAENGTLEKLLDLAEASGILVDAVTETTIDHATKKLNQLTELSDQLLQSPMMKAMPKLLEVSNEAYNEVSSTEQKPVGIFGLMGLLKEPAIQRLLQTSAATIKKLEQ